METRHSAVMSYSRPENGEVKFPLLSYNRMFVSRTLSRFADTGDVLDRPRLAVHVLHGQFLSSRGCNNGIN